MNSLLSICIPTYNRADILCDALEHLIPLASRWGIAIYVSDNASTDDTGSVVAQARARYPNVFLHRNVQNIGMDGNFEVALRLARTEYAWLLGDDDRIHHNALEVVLKRLVEAPCDLLLLNGGSADHEQGRVTGQHLSVYDDPSVLLHDLGWHITWISGLVVSTRLVATMDFKKYIGTYFSHFGSLFDALAQQTVVNVQWYNGSCYFPSAFAKFTWAPRVLEIFAEKWSQVVLSLPERYSLAIKEECIRAHSRYTQLFSIMGFLNLRAQGAITRSKIKHYRESLLLATDINPQLALLIASLPVWMLRTLRYIYIELRSLNSMRKMALSNQSQVAKKLGNVIK